MTVASGNFAELLWPGIAATFGEQYTRYETLYSKCFNVTKATKRFEKAQGLTGLPLASIKPEGQSVDYEDPMQGFQKEFVMVTYGLGSTITREMVDDEQYSYINQIPAMLAESMRQTEETVSFNIFNRGFNSAFTGADGVELFSNAHPLPPGGTQSNLLTTAADLTQTSMETMLQQIQQAQDDQGLQIRLRAKCLVVHPDFNFRARKLLESSYVTGSADNDINPLVGLVPDLVVSPYLTDSDAWFIVTNARNGLMFWRRRSTEVERDNEFDTQNLKIMTTSRWDVDWADWRGAFGTPGA